MNPADTPAGTLNVNRLGTRVYSATNSRGASLVIGDGEGQFTPGELLKLAVLGCNVLSGDSRFASVLGDDYQMDASVHADYQQDGDLFTHFFVSLFPDLTDMDPAAREQLLRRAVGAINRNCTISHTLTQGAPTSLTIDGTEL